MQQKIVMKVQMKCQKCWTTALQIAATADGVKSVELQGDEKDKIMVIGNGVDPVNITKCLRKKLGYAVILTVNPI